MTDSPDTRPRIRRILEEVAAGGPLTVDNALDRILQICDPFEQIAMEELEQYRSTFTELAK